MEQYHNELVIALTSLISAIVGYIKARQKYKK